MTGMKKRFFPSFSYLKKKLFLVYSRESDRIKCFNLLFIIRLIYFKFYTKYCESITRHNVLFIRVVLRFWKHSLFTVGTVYYWIWRQSGMPIDWTSGINTAWVNWHSITKKYLSFGNGIQHRRFPPFRTIFKINRVFDGGQKSIVSE